MGKKDSSRNSLVKNPFINDESPKDVSDEDFDDERAESDIGSPQIEENT